MLLSTQYGVTIRLGCAQHNAGFAILRNNQNKTKNMLKIAATCQLSPIMHFFQPLKRISKLEKNKQTNKTASTKVKLQGLNNEN